MVPEWFESPESQLSNHPGTIKNGSVYSRLRTRSWSQRNYIVLPHYIMSSTGLGVMDSTGQTPLNPMFMHVSAGGIGGTRTALAAENHHRHQAEAEARRGPASANTRT